MRDDPQPAQVQAAAPTGMLWLMGQPHLADFLDFVREQVAGGSRLCPRALADDWRAANDVYYDIEADEAGLADTIDCRPVDAAVEPLVAALMATPHYRNTFDTLPMSVELVELDKLMVSQTYLACGPGERRGATLRRGLDAEALFRYCQPLVAEPPTARIERADGGKYIVSSTCTDLRAHEPQLLTGARLDGIESVGPVSAALALIVGFGSNFFTAIRSDRRLVLHNGYHRAYAMRAAGITHAPCLIQTVTRKDELRIAATDKVSSDPEFFFRAKRPPLLKDFFDPRLVRRFPVRPRRTVVEIEYTMRRTWQVEVDPDA